MSRFLDLGLGISIINVYYSLTYFLMWCVELDDNRNAGGDNNEPFVWLAVYVLNLLLNVFLFLGLRKRDRLAIVIWFSLTLAWLVAKLMDHKRGCRLDGRGSMYRLLNALLEVYVIISFVVMLLVYIYLPRRGSARRKARRAVDHVDPMIELIDKTQVESPQLQLETREAAADAERCVEQQVSNFEFHRADD